MSIPQQQGLGSPIHSPHPSPHHLYHPSAFSTVNAFTNTTKDPTPYEWFKIVLCSLTLAPLRVLLCAILFLLSFVIAKLIMIGQDELQGWRLETIRVMTKTLIRSLLFVLGFYYIPRTGTYDEEVDD